MASNDVAHPADDPQDVFDRRNFAWASTTVVLVLSIVSYGMRMWARKRSRQPFGWDDWLMGAGLIFSIEPAICQYVLLANGLGHHIWNVPANQQYNFIRTSFALQRANAPALVSIKLSILCFYLRLFPSKKFAWFAYANMFLAIGWGIAAFFVNLTVCTPIAFFYDKTIQGGSCKNQAVSGSINGALSLFGDVLILLMPLPMVWKLQINHRRKIALMGFFLLGAAVCVASAVRIAAIVNFVATDGTYTQVYASTWTYMEMGIAVISGNLPLMRPLFERFFRSKNGTTAYGYSASKDGKAQLGSNSGSRTLGTGNRSVIGTSGRKVDGEGFERISDADTEAEAIRTMAMDMGRNESDLELGNMRKDGRIIVTTEVTVQNTSDAKPNRRNNDW